MQVSPNTALTRFATSVKNEMPVIAEALAFAIVSSVVLACALACIALAITVGTHGSPNWTIVWPEFIRIIFNA